MRYPYTVPLLLLAAATLAGCGQTGGLYLPADEAPVAAPAPVEPTTDELEESTDTPLDAAP